MGALYLNVAEVGQRIRAYDRQGRDSPHIEGEVIGTASLPELAFVVKVDAEYCGDGSGEFPSRLEKEIRVPMELFRDWPGRIVNTDARPDQLVRTPGTTAAFISNHRLKRGVIVRFCDGDAKVKIQMPSGTIVTLSTEWVAVEGLAG